MGLADRDYMKNRDRDKNNWSTAQRASPRRSSGTQKPNRKPKQKQKTLVTLVLWVAVLLVGTAGAKWFLDERQSQPFPPTGEVAWYVGPTQGPTAPLTIQAPAAGNANFVVLLDQWASKAPVAMIPVRAGEVAQLRVPLGQYRMTLIKGRDWQGSGKLFRHTLSSKEVVHPMDFVMVGDRFSGHTIQLETPTGNLETAPSRR